VGKAFGKYTLERRLGGGGMAEVFRARLHGPEGFEKDIALKLILPHFSSEPEFVEMFIREATLAAKLDHANIVRIHEFDQVQGRYYIAMELVDGKDLRRLLARSREIHRPLSVPEAASIALAICQGLAFAHGELIPGSPEVVHRDISPHNIIVSKAGEVKITDFGIAKLASSAGVTKTGVIKGKAAYMSPEQARGEPVDKRSDLFSLGCVLWELLTGQRLFTGDNDMAIMRNIQQGTVHPPSRYNPDVTGELDEIVLKLLARDSNRRYAQASEVAADLEKIEGAGRSTLLVDLYRDLFSGVREGTGKLPAVAANSTLASEIPTVSAEVISSPPAKTRRLWIAAAAATVVVAAMVAVFLPMLLDEPEKMPAPKLDAEAMAPAVKLPPPVEPGPAEGEGIREIEPAPVPAPTRAPTTVKKPTGSLCLNAIPWAKVYRGKRFLGDTPLEDLKLPVGKHRLRLVNDELKVDRTVTVVILKNQTTRDVFDLKDK
jgi:serine/threonine protein kinase